MADVELDNIAKTFGPTAALQDISFRVPSGTLMTIVGPSGCGKSTLLRIVSGLEAPDGGRVLIAGHDVTGWPPKERGCAMVFQSYALYPHWTVRQNIGFPLRVRHLSHNTIESRVCDIAESLGLSGKLDQRPKALSGGERQRVALGRAIAADPKVFLFDEPLSNLDAPLRAGMRAEIVARQKDLGKTALYVTHDQTEALTMGDRVLVLNHGRMMGLGTPEELYHNPPNRFVAEFLGRPPINITHGKVRGANGSYVFEPHQWSLHDKFGAVLSAHEGEVDLGVRPEDIRLEVSSDQDAWRITAREFLGDKIEYRLIDAQSRELIALLEASTSFAPGDLVQVSIRPDRVMLFAPQDGRRLE